MYYANHKPVVLEMDDEFLAFDMDDIEHPTAEFERFVEEHAEPLRRTVYVVPIDELTDEARNIIKKNSAGRTVFRLGDQLVIVLPEIRVEDEDDLLESKLAGWVKQHKELAQTKKDPRGRTIIEPINKSGSDALEIARSLVEDLKVESAQPRMVQKIRSPRPRTT